MTQHLASVDEIFFEALKLVSETDRDAFLMEACGGNSDLRTRVERLLQAYPEAGSFLEAPGAPATPTIGQPVSEKPGNQIGPYKLLQQIGEGGMGTVFLAEQHEPVQRRVALKVIKPGMDTRQVIARFDAERQALSLMDHPNIARVLDAGTTAYGRPYFVMELVKGQPITKYCDQHQLTPRQRLELFVSACNAIQHAHQKGIIHRDVKPSNVLVAEYDDRPVCKVIDFGVAKALNQPLTEKSMFTGVGQILGTLEYMSPEQAKVNQLDIDTRSDVYSLGVLLYELLTGTTPFNKQRLGSAAWDEMLRIIREEEPPKPSTRLSDSQDSLAAISASRHTEPAKLTKLVRGELDWIVMKALEKDRGRRYETANGFAMDIQRYLADEPVKACPPSAAYRFRKFARKHKAVVGTASAAFLILLMGVAGLAMSNSLIRREQAKTLTALNGANEQRDRAIAAEGETKARSDELKLVSDFQAGMLEHVDPTEAGKLLTADVQAKFEAALTNAGVPEPERTQRVGAFTAEWKNVNATDAARALFDRTILRPVVEAIDKQLADQPLVDAQLRQVLADRYRDLGLYDAALPLQERALATRRRVLGEEHSDTLLSISHLGTLLTRQGRLSDAEPYLREALEKRRRLLGEEHPDTLTSINNLGFLLMAQGKQRQAEPYVREALEKNRRMLGEEHPHTLASISNMGDLLYQQGTLSEAEPYYRDALEKRRRVLGEDHPDTVASINNLGRLMQVQGKLSEAEPYFRNALEKQRRLQGEENPNTITAIHNLGVQLKAQGKLSEAESYLRESLEKNRRVKGDSHPNTLSSIASMGWLLCDQEKLNEAEPYLREALEKCRRVLGDEHPITLGSIAGLGTLLLAQGNLNEAEPYLREGMDGGRRVLGKEHFQTLGYIINLGMLLQAQSKYAETVELLAPIEASSRKAFVDGIAWRLARLLMTLGKARMGLGEFTTAEANLLEAQPIFVQSRGLMHKDTRECTQALVDLYTVWHTVEPDNGYDTKAAEWKTKLDEVAQPATDPIPEKGEMMNRELWIPRVFVEFAHLGLVPQAIALHRFAVQEKTCVQQRGQEPGNERKITEGDQP